MKTLGFFAALCVVCVLGVIVLDDTSSQYDMAYSIFYVGGIVAIVGGVLTGVVMGVKSIFCAKQKPLQYNPKCVVNNWPSGSHIDARR